MPPPIKGFIENTLLDWEGKLAAMVFLPGCNFRCPWCHARHLVHPAPSDETIPLDAVRLSLRRQQGWVDGVVISGGEPTIHDDLLPMIRAFRQDGLQVKLDTNGSRPEVLADLLARRVLDYVAMDVKAPLERYAEVCGEAADPQAIRRSIDLLLNAQIPYEFRTTVCPGQIDGDDIEMIAEEIEGARLYYLQTFRPLNCLDREMDSLKPHTLEDMRGLLRRAARYVQRCVVRGDQASELVCVES